jgi:hypothetical protein
VPRRLFFTSQRTVCQNLKEIAVYYEKDRKVTFLWQYPEFLKLASGGTYYYHWDLNGYLFEKVPMT